MTCYNFHRHEGVAAASPAVHEPISATNNAHAVGQGAANAAFAEKPEAFRDTNVEGEPSAWFQTEPNLTIEQSPGWKESNGRDSSLHNPVDTDHDEAGTVAHVPSSQKRLSVHQGDTVGLCRMLASVAVVFSSRTVTKAGNRSQENTDDTLMMAA